MILDGVGGSEAWDSSGEKLEVAGADIDDVPAGTCLLNWEHGDPDEQGPSAIVGKVIFAKKIYERSDCENDRQRHYWDQTKLPFIYIVCRLFDDAGHRQAQNLAAIIRDAVKHGELQVCRFSVEGHTLRREGQVLKETLVRRWAITVKPANKSSLAGIVEDKEAPEGFEVHPEKTEEDELAKILAAAAKDQKVKKYEKLSSGWGSLNKALTAGVGAGVAPSQLTGHQANMVEDRSLRRKKIEELVRKAVDLPGDADVRAFAKANMSEVSDEFLDHFKRATEALRVKLGRKLAKTDFDPNEYGRGTPPGDPRRTPEYAARVRGDPGALRPGQMLQIRNVTQSEPVTPGTILHVHDSPTTGRTYALTVRNERTGDEHHFLRSNWTNNWNEIAATHEDFAAGEDHVNGRFPLGRTPPAPWRFLYHVPPEVENDVGDADPTRKAETELEKAQRNDNVRAALMVLLANHGRYRLTERALRHCVYTATGRSQEDAQAMGAGWNVGAARQRRAGLWKLQPDGTVAITDLGISRLYEKHGRPSAEELMNYDAGVLHPAAHRYLAPPPAPPVTQSESGEAKKSEPNWEALAVELGRLAVLMKADGAAPKVDAPPLDACPECTGGVAPGGGVCYACGGRGRRVQGLDADLHGVDHLNDSDEQRALVHGLVTEPVERPPHAEIGSGSDHHWVVHPSTGRHAIVKRAGSFARDNEIDVARHEVAYHNLARDIFGLGHHVPLTAAFVEPGSIDKELHPADYFNAVNDPAHPTGKMHSVQEVVPDAEHVARIDGWNPPDTTSDQQDVLRSLLDDGSLDKIAIMNAALANNDRHAGNYVFSPHGARLHLIDNGYAFAGKFSNTPNYLLAANPKRDSRGYRMLDEAPHKAALDWLIGLSGVQLERDALKYGITAPRAAAARARLEAMQRRAVQGHDYGVTRRDLFTEARHGPSEFADTARIV